MNFTRTTLGFTLAIGMACAVATAQSQNNQQNNQSNENNSMRQNDENGPSAQSNNNPSQAPVGWVLLDERDVVLTANEPQNHFLRAQELLKANDFRAAAAEARIGATYLDMQAARDRGNTTDNLKQAASQLRQVASQISQQGQQASQQQQSQQSNRQLDQQLFNAFSQANIALAKHFQTLANNEVQKNRAIIGGYDLQSAASSLRAAYVWSKEQEPQQVAQAIEQSKELAQKLITPTGSSQSIDLGEQAQTAGARMTPQESQQSQQQNEQGIQVPSNAQQVIDQLGSAIQQANFPQNGQSQQNSSQSNRQNQPSQR